MDDLIREAQALVGDFGRLEMTSARVAREITAELEKIERWKTSRDYELRTPQGRKEAEQEMLARMIELEAESDATVMAARELAAKLDEVGFEPGTGLRYGQKGYSPERAREEANMARFSSTYITLSDPALDAYKRVGAMVAEEVDDATTPAELERMLEAAMTSDPGKLFAVARAIERREKRREAGAPISQKLRDLLNVAYERLRDPRRAKARELAKAVAERTVAAGKRVNAARRDALAREETRRMMYSRF